MLAVLVTLPATKAVYLMESNDFGSHCSTSSSVYRTETSLLKGGYALNSTIAQVAAALPNKSAATSLS